MSTRQDLNKAGNSDRMRIKQIQGTYNTKFTIEVSPFPLTQEKFLNIIKVGFCILDCT